MVAVNNMKVLLVYPWSHHCRMMNKLSDILNENGIDTDVLCLANYEFITKKVTVISAAILLIEWFISKIRPVRFRSRLRKKYERYLLPLLFKQYDKIDFHAFMDHYLNMMSGCIANGIKFDLCLWGSDVLRATPEDFSRREFGYINCNRIKSIELLQKKVSSVYDERFNAKFSTVYFGNSNYPVIDSLEDVKCEAIAKQMGIFVPEKITVVCGYNGMVTQQHKLMLDEIDMLSNEYKDKIHIVIPMTYGQDEMYKLEIDSIVRKMNVSYKILDYFLSPEQLAVLRHMSTITLNTQTTDAFCGALQESLYCENIVMIADWLEYPPYDKNDVFYIKTKVEDIHTNLSKVLSDFSTYRKLTEGNHKKLRSISSWEGVSEAWIKAYEL